MPSLNPPANPGRWSQRRVIGLAAVLTGLAGFAVLMLSPDHGGPASRGEELATHLVVLAAWCLILPLAFAWNRYLRRTAYDQEATARPAAETFQSKRYWLLIVIALYIGAVMTPVVADMAAHLSPATTVVDRLFDAVLLLGPCALAVGLMTSAIYPKSMGRAIDDELTAQHRARAFNFGFGVFLASGGAGFAAALLQPAWALPAAPIVIGVSVSAMALRFALLERAAQQAG